MKYATRYSLLTILYLLFSIHITGCSDSDIPDPVLVNTYSSVLVIRESYGDSTIIRSKCDSVMKANGYDSAEFYSELRKMSTTPELFKNFFDSVQISLARKRSK